MILNLTGNVKSFSSDEIAKLSNLLSSMRIKGTLEGIILEIFAQRDEGLIDFDGNKIRVALPEGARLGDRVRIKAEAKDENVVLKVSQRDKQVTIKTGAKISKEKVFNIKIPEKVDIKEVIAGIKDEVINLKSALKGDASFTATVDKIEKFLGESTVKITPDMSTKELGEQIAKYVKRSGISFEGKLKDIALTSETGKKVGDSSLREVHDDIKFRVSDIVKELKVFKESATSDVNRSKAFARVTEQLNIIVKDLAAKAETKGENVAQVNESVAAVAKELTATLPRLDSGAIDKIVDFLIKITGSMENNDVVVKESVEAVLKTVNTVKTIIQSGILPPETAAIIDPAQVLVVRGISDKSDALIAKLMSLNTSLLETGVGVEKAAGDKSALEYSRIQPQEPKGEKPIHAEPHKNLLSFVKALKREVETLLNELKSLKAQEGAKAYDAERVIKTVEALAKGFAKLIDGIEYQQLTNLKTADGSMNYFALPTIFDETLQMPEIMIRSKKSKKGKGKGDNDSRIEVFVDLESAGHIKADFSVVGSDIVGNFFSVEDETVSVIERELPSLIECLTRREYNVVKVNSKKVRSPKKCEVCPEDKLKLDDIKIFDFKV